jgi:hypothetical protein
MAEQAEIEYQVTVTGLGEASAAANSAATQAKQASASLETARSLGSQAIPILFSSVRALTNARQAAEQANKAIRDLDPMMALYAFVNMVQTVQALTSLMKALKTSTAAASAAQAILTTLAGAWWLIPLAIAAGALVYSRIQSMQAGGLIKDTGPYLLHRGEYIVPERQVLRTERIIERSPASVNRFGPIYVSFEKQPKEDERDAWMRGLEERLAQKIRRGG